MYGQPMMQPMMQPMQPMYGQPGYMQPPPMQPMYGAPQQTGPTIIKIDVDGDGNGSPCQFCGTNTGQIVRKKVGCVAIAWGLCLLWATGFLCCLPCCMDGCKDS